MSRRIKSLIVLSIAGVCTVCMSCKVFNKIGKAAGAGFENGLINSLTQDSAKVHDLEKKILAEVRRQTSGMSQDIRNNLLGKETKQWLEETLKKLTDEEHQAIVDLVSDPRLANSLKRIMVGLREEMLGQATAREISILRDSLLGPRTRQLTDSLISHAMRQLANGSDSFLPKIDTVINHLVKAEEGMRGDLQKTIDRVTNQLYGAIGLIALAVIAIILIVRKAKLHHDTVVAMAQAIDSLESKNDFDNVAKKVYDLASARGVNNNLNRILEKADLAKRKDYRNYQQQAINAVVQKTQNKEALLRDIESDESIKKEVKELVRTRIYDN